MSLNYSRSDGHLLWGRDMREFGPIGGGRVFVAGSELYLWVHAFAGFDQPADVSKLLHMDADTGATLWSTDLPRSPGMYFDSIVAINAGPDGLLLTRWSGQRVMPPIKANRSVRLASTAVAGQSARWQLTLTPLELLDRLARFIPPPRRHLHRYHGVFAPHAALRAQVTARAGEAIAALVATAIAQSATSGLAADAPAVAENLAEAIRAQLGQPAKWRKHPTAPA